MYIRFESDEEKSVFSLLVHGVNFKTGNRSKKGTLTESYGGDSSVYRQR